MMFGRHASTNASGVSSSNATTRLTASSAATTASLSSCVLSGRPVPLARRRADASVLTPTTSAAPRQDVEYAVGEHQRPRERRHAFRERPGGRDLRGESRLRHQLMYSKTLT